MSKERVQLEEVLIRTNAEMGQSRGQAQMLQQRLAAEAEEHRRQQEILEQVAERALQSRIGQVETRAEIDRLALAGQIRALEEMYKHQVGVGEITDKTQKEKQDALQRIIDSTR
eukprot:8707439-Prorocentrum_lima.AAC.1